MSGNSPYGNRQVLISGRFRIVKVEIAAVGVISTHVPLRGCDTTRSRRQIRIRNNLLSSKINVANAIVVMFVSVRRGGF